MIITTTPNIEGYEIIEYFEPMIINKAINIIDISEWLIGIQNSDSALSGMQHLKEEVLREMQEKISIILNKPDAIVGFSLDYDQIGGKSGGMLMVSAIGTPVKLKKVDKTEKLFSIFELLENYLITTDEKEKILLEYEMQTKNIGSELKNKIIAFLEKQEKETLIAKKIEKEKINERLKEKKLEIEKFPIRKNLIEENVKYIKCGTCSCYNYTDSITDLKCNQCGNLLETNGEKFYY